MNRLTRHRHLILAAALALLSLRALTPDGYMPAAAGSGLLFELCPEGMPAEVMQALGSGHHHHHGDDADDATVDAGQCPIGHMLASAVAHDADADTDVAPATAEFAAPPVRTHIAAAHSRYRTRAPPA